ncbi:MAG TPA: alpha/beta fold hydrolase [Gammaproteobacteria bacterium]|jgi:pimeloyl-ACP methyl ester carboxylesterase
MERRTSVKRTIVSVVAIVAVVYAAVCGGLYVGQRSLLYFPTPESHATGANALRVETADATLKVWHIAHGSDHAILYFGGNAEDVAWNIEPFTALFPESDVYLVNYRGYGGSSGSPSEAALLQDAEAVYDAIRTNHSAVSVIGRSLGSGVAVHVASVRDIRRIVLVTPYDSVMNVAKEQYAIFPVALMLKDTFDSYSKADAIDVPTLVLLAERDRVIPHRHSARLVTALSAERVRVQTIQGTNHDSIADSGAYRQALRDFLRI